MFDGVPSIYSSVEKIARVQREAAKETACVFFDLLKFMGGPGSFLKWFEEDPPLMRADFTHFTYSGGALMAEGLARALMAEVEEYKNEGTDGN